jgi:hypothetical protein
VESISKYPFVKAYLSKPLSVGKVLDLSKGNYFEGQVLIRAAFLFNYVALL